MGLTPLRRPGSASPRCYTAARNKTSSGGTTIAEVLRRAWDSLVRKQWLILYPLALGVIHSIAFFAVYAAQGAPLSWDAYFKADFDRWTFVKEALLTDFSWTPTLAVGVFVALAVCGFAAMIRAPYFRAIVAMGYPMAPRNAREAVHLFFIYAFTNAVFWLLPMVIPDVSGLRELYVFASYLVGLLIVFADYIIVYEQRSFVEALRRSVALLRQRWLVVVLLVLVAQLVYFGIHSLYDSFYATAEGIFLLLPLSRLLVDSFVILIIDLVLIFTYQQLRRTSRQ